jgi:hypothetical protein
MKKLDPRSVIIGFLVAVIGFMSIGATNTTFDSITVGTITMKDEGFFLVNSQNEIVLQVMSDQSNVIAYYNKKGKPVMFIGENDDGNGIIELDNDAGKTTVLLATDDKGRGVISVMNANGQPTVTLSHIGEDAGVGAIKIHNKHGKEVVYLSNTVEDDGQVILSDRYGEAQWAMTGKRK